MHTQFQVNLLRCVKVSNALQSYASPMISLPTAQKPYLLCPSAPSHSRDKRQCGSCGERKMTMAHGEMECFDLQQHMRVQRVGRAIGRRQ